MAPDPESNEEAGLGPLAKEGEPSWAASSADYDRPKETSKESNDKDSHEKESASGRFGEGRASSSFIPANSASEGVSSRAAWQIRLRTILNHSWVETLIAMAIFLNFLLICLETDSRAEFPGKSEGGEPPEWVSIGMAICYFFFVGELFVRLAAEGRDYCTNSWNKLDVLIIAIGAFEYILSLMKATIGGLGIIRVVRLVRLLRLMRVLRLFSVLKELRRLLEMMGSCFKTLFWSFLLLCLVMTIWATIAVEVLNPMVLDVAEKHGVWGDCERCKRSFSSVFMANITFFQTVVAGDSWGYIAVPVIEEYPMSAVIFIGALLTLVFGVLNLIVAVIVDTFAENREKDVTARAADMDAEEVAEKRVLAKIFEKIDEDQSGALSFDELQMGAQKVKEFRHWLRVMDIDAQDLRQLFLIVDEDGSGEIDPDEFIEAMYRMKNAESRTATKFVKHIVTRMERDQQALKTDLNRIDSTLEKVSCGSPAHGLIARAEEDLSRRLQDQEVQIQRAIEIALSKAAEVALEAGLHAATGATRSVLDSIRSSSKELVGGVQSRLQHRPLGVSSQRRPLPPPPGQPPGPSGGAASRKLGGVSLPRARHSEETTEDSGEPPYALESSRAGTGPVVLVHASGGDDGNLEAEPPEAEWC